MSKQQHQTFEDLYFCQLKDLYDAEHQLLEAIPKMIHESHSPELKDGLSDHLKETKLHVKRLESIFSRHNLKPEKETCKAMKGLISECNSEMKDWKDINSVKDAVIIASAQRMEHYEMAGYGTAKCFAQTLGFSDDVGILEKTLDEEKNADQSLNDIAIGSVNRHALRSTEGDLQERAFS